MMNFIQRIGKALLLPVAVLPAAALLLRLGQDDLLDIPFLAASGDAIFANLALLFAIGVAVGISNDGNGAAGLAGAAGYLILTEGAIAVNETINMGVLAGIVSGIIAGLLYNRFHKIKLPDWLGFFGGRRFVPIITAVTMVILAYVFGFIWPSIQMGIDSIGQWMIGAGTTGVGVWGVLNRLLIPLGLHHILNTLVMYEFGDFVNAAGELISGDIPRFFGGDPSAGIFMTGFFPIMMFGLPAAGFAMVYTAKKEKRKATMGLVIGLAFTAFLTGITEPIEFSFMFLSPILYVVHAVLTGLSFVVTYTLGIHHGYGFSAGAIDYVLNFGIAQKPLLLIPIGLAFAAVYFLVFVWFIKKFDLKTPGREDDDIQKSDSPAVSNGDKYDDMAENFMVALGGKGNITSIDNCATRLRLGVADTSVIDDQSLKAHGAKGTIKVDSKNYQVIVGPNVEFVAEAMKHKTNL